MARRFLRVDLSDLARDFRPVAIEPGVPLLDRSGTNAKILLKWLGGVTAEPEWEGESVNFYVRDDHGGRLEEVTCYPASNDDLQGALKADLEALRQRASRIKPENSTEQGVHKAILQELAALLDTQHRTDRDNYFFRYKDVNGRWRLVWCWGYQRIDQEPASPLVCHDPKCNLLFVRRPGQSAKCPGCSAMQVLAPAKGKPNRWWLVAGLLLILLGAVLLFGFLSRRPPVATLNVGPARNPAKLTIEPQTLELGVGTTAHLKLVGDYGNGTRADLTVAAFWVPNRDSVVFCHNGFVEGLAEGTTQVVARYQATPDSKPLEAVAKVRVRKVDFKGLELRLDPLHVPLGRASRLEVNALSNDGKRYSVLQSSRLKLELDPPEIASVYGPYLEGRRAGRGKLEATWSGNLRADLSFDVAPVEGVFPPGVKRPGPTATLGPIRDEPASANAVDSTADGLVTNLRIEPYEATIHPGQVIAYRVTGVRNGVRELLLPDDGVALSATDPAVAVIDGLNVQGTAPGTTNLVARLGGQQARAMLSVVDGDGTPEVVTRVPGSRVAITDDRGRPVDEVIHVDDQGQVHHYHSREEQGSGEGVGDDPYAVQNGPAIRRVEQGSVRFLDVEATTSEQIVPDFTVRLDVTAAPSDRPLEYRAYRSGEPPPETWTPAQPQGDRQRITLEVGPIETGPRSTWYDVRVEARDPADGSVHQLPVRLQFRHQIEVNPKDAKPEPTEDQPGETDETEKGGGAI